jgi:hypothetical protein
MTPLQCFRKKIGAGIVQREIGMNLAETIERFETLHGKRLAAHEAAMEAAKQALGEAEAIALRKSEIALGSVEAQLNILKGQRAYEISMGNLIEKGQQPLWERGWKFWEQDPLKTPLTAAMRSFLTRDPAEIATWGNVHYEARNVRDQAHVIFRDAIELARPKNLGMKAERALEIDILDVLYDPAAQVSASARSVAKAWKEVSEMLRQMYVDNKGALAFREDWHLPNPSHDTLKIRSVVFEDYSAFVHSKVNRDKILDFETGKRMDDDRFNQLLREMYDSIVSGGSDAPSSARKGQKMLATRRAESRFLVFQDAAAWRDYAEKFSSTSSVFEVMTGHIAGMADDIAMLKILGPNPEGTKQFMLSLFDLEAARLSQQASLANPKDADAALKLNQRIEAQVRAGKRSFENLWAEVTSSNDVPVNIQLAHGMSELKGGLVASQMGSAIVSSITDPAMMMMTARFNGIPAMGALNRAVAGMSDPNYEINAAQLGIAADGLAHALHNTDRFMGDTIKTGRVAQIGSAVIRASGLRQWTGVLRAAFASEVMAFSANQQAKKFTDLDKQFQGMLMRYDIDEAGWEVMQKAVPSEPKKDARFLTANDIRALETSDAKRIADNWQRAIDTEMDYAVIEGDPITSSLIKGQSQPGTVVGEVRRAVGMYKSFSMTFVALHFARAFARGFDGERLSHAALTMSALTFMGMIAFQAKQVMAGKDPVTMDPTDQKGVKAWAAAALQGGGLGIFGDLLFQDQTRQGTSFANTLAGPVFATTDKVVGDFLIANLQRLWKGEKTHFAGDAIYTAAGLVPGSSLWYLRTSYQRSIVDQLALMIDYRAPERFARIESNAQKQWGQSFWRGPGRSESRRAPDLSAAFGNR